MKNIRKEVAVCGKRLEWRGVESGLYSYSAWLPIKRLGNELRVDLIPFSDPFPPFLSDARSCLPGEFAPLSPQ